MPRRPGPSVKSRRLAVVLRRLRSASGLSAVEVSRQTDLSPSKVSRMESAEIGFYIDDLEKLLDLYRVSPQRRVELVDVARHAEQRGWLRMNNPYLPHDWQTWVDFEDEASGLQQYAPLTIPGLLQTPEYARAVIEATGHGLTPEEIDALVTSRMARQGLLSRADPLRLDVVINESALSQPFGREGAPQRQLRRLLDSAAQLQVTIRVLPPEAGLHPGLAGSFTILQYDHEPSLVLLENSVSNHLLDEEEHIEAYGKSWQRLIDLACDADESLDVIDGLAKRAA